MPHVMFASPLELTITVEADGNGKLHITSVSGSSGVTDNSILQPAAADGSTLDTVITTMTNRSRPIELEKTDSVTGRRAEGAVFELHTNGEKLYFDSNSQILTREQVLTRINQEGGTEITDITSEAAERAMQDAGITSTFTIGEISLKGAAMTGYTYNNETHTFTENTPVVYEVVEVSPPPGYAIIHKSNFFKVRGIRNEAETSRVRYTGMEVVLTDEDGNDLLDENNEPLTAYQNISVTDSTLTITISNQAGMELPHTGGTGRHIYIVIGLLLMILAGTLMLGKRMKR